MDPHDFTAIGAWSGPPYYDESMMVDLSELSLNPAHEESYFADEESNLSDSSCISPIHTDGFASTLLCPQFPL